MVFEIVFIPWEHVFICWDLELVQAQWWETSAYLFGNGQAQIRFSTKLDLLIGLTLRVARMKGVEERHPVRGVIGELAARVASVKGLIHASEENHVSDEYGVAYHGRAEVYANMAMQSEVYPKLLNMVRERWGADPAAVLCRRLREPGDRR